MAAGADAAGGAGVIKSQHAAEGQAGDGAGIDGLSTPAHIEETSVATEDHGAFVDDKTSGKSFSRREGEGVAAHLGQAEGTTDHPVYRDVPARHTAKRINTAGANAGGGTESDAARNGGCSA